MGGVVKLHIKTLEKSHRECAGRRRHGIEFAVADHTHRAFLVCIRELAEVAADARIVSCKFEISCFCLAPVARNTRKLLMFGYSV